MFSKRMTSTESVSAIESMSYQSDESDQIIQIMGTTSSDKTSENQSSFIEVNKPKCKDCLCELQCISCLKQKQEQMESGEICFIDILPITTVSKNNEIPDQVYDIKIDRNEAIMKTPILDQKTAILLKQYKSPPLDMNNRIIKGTYEYNLIKYDRRFQNPRQQSYGNIMNYGKSREILNKFIIEHNINFSYDKFEYLTVFYDIETFVDEPDQQHKFDNYKSHISCIGSQWTFPDGKMIFKIYTLNKYLINNQEIGKKLKEYAKLGSIRLEIHKFETEQEMCIQFMNNINQMKIPVILVGFASNSDKKRKEQKQYMYGFDAPFIFQRSKVRTATQLELKTGFSLWGSKKNTYQITNSAALPNTYMLDFQIYLYQDLTGKEKTQLNKFGLNDYLQLFEIPLKMEHNYQEMNTKLRDQQFVDDILTYCLYDCHCLHLANEKRQIINKLLTDAQLLNLPLSYGLYLTDAAKLNFNLTRRFYNQGYLLMFDSIYTGQYEKYKGATTELCPEEYRFKVIQNSAMNDYKSLYPSSAIDKNISPDTLIDNSDSQSILRQCNCIDINYQNKFDTKQQNIEQKLVYFRKDKQGIIPAMMEEMLELRNQMKQKLKSETNQQQRKLLNNKEIAYKKFANSLYGLTGQSSSNIFYMQCSSAITAVGRMACDVLRQSIQELNQSIVISMRDTDSTGYFAPNLTFKDIMILQPQLQEKVNKYMNSNRFIAELETETIPHLILYTEARKSYMRIQYNINSPDKRQFIIKGLPLSIYPPYIKEQILSTFESIMYEAGSVSFDHQSDIFVKRTDLFIGQHRDQILNGIKTQNKEILANYCPFVKYSENNNICKFISQQYPNYVMSGAFQIVPYETGRRLKTEKYIPIELIQNYGLVMIDRLIQFIHQPFSKFLIPSNLKTTSLKYFLNNFDEFNMNSDLIKCRVENGYNKQKTTCYKSIDKQFIEQYILKYNKQSVHEMLNDTYNQMFFDIETEGQISNITVIIDYIQLYIMKQIEQIIRDYHLTEANKYENNKLVKSSYHLVLPVAISLCDNQYIANQINHKFGNICDLSVYRVNGSLRLPNSPKINENGVIEYRLHKIVTKQSQFTNFLVSDTFQIPVIKQSILFNKNIPISGINQIQYIDNRIIQLTNEYILQHYKQDQFQIQIAPNNRIDIRMLSEYKCVICAGLHNNDNLFAYISQNSIKINCYSNKQRQQNKYKPVIIPIPQTKQIKDPLKRFKDAVKQYKENIIPNAIISKADNSKSFQEQDMQFDIDERLVFIKANMGAGKTKQLKKHIDSGNYQTIICLSFRRTFATDFAQKLQLTNYQDIQQHKINNCQYPRVILQVDSLFRYDPLVDPDLLVIDEIQSILPQFISIQRNTSKYSIDTFIKLLQTSRKIVAMDAFLQPSTVEFIKYLADFDRAIIYQHISQPKRDYTYQIEKFSNSSDADKDKIIEQYLYYAVKKNKKITGMIGSEQLIKSIKEVLQKNGIKVITYTGQDEEICQNDIKMKAIKAEHFKDVHQHWTNYQVILYSPTLTAGVSFELDYFDMQINVFLDKHSGDCNSFLQGCHRIRNLTDKHVISFIECINQSRLTTPYDYTHMDQHFNEILGHKIHYNFSNQNQFVVYIRSLIGALQQYSAEYIINCLKMMGYQIKIGGELQDEYLAISHKEMKEIRLNQLIQNIATITLSQHEYEQLLDPKTRQQFIDNSDDQTLQFKLEKMKLCKIFKLQFNDSALSDQNQIAQMLKQKEQKKLENKLNKILENVQTQDIKQIEKHLQDKCKQIIKQREFDEITQQINTCVQGQDIYEKMATFYQLLIGVDVLKTLKSKDIITTELIEEIQNKYASNKTLKSIGIKLDSRKYKQHFNLILEPFKFELEVLKSGGGKKGHTISYKLIQIE